MASDDDWNVNDFLQIEYKDFGRFAQMARTVLRFSKLNTRVENVNIVLIYVFSKRYYFVRPTITHKIFETNSSFHVKWRKAAKV